MFEYFCPTLAPRCDLFEVCRQEDLTVFEIPNKDRTANLKSVDVGVLEDPFQRPQLSICFRTVLRSRISARSERLSGISETVVTKGCSGLYVFSVISA